MTQKDLNDPKTFEDDIADVDAELGPLLKKEANGNTLTKKEAMRRNSLRAQKESLEKNLKLLKKKLGIPDDD